MIYEAERCSGTSNTSPKPPSLIDRGAILKDFFAIGLAKKSFFDYNNVYKVQAIYKTKQKQTRKACTKFEKGDKKIWI